MALAERVLTADELIAIALGEAVFDPVTKTAIPIRLVTNTQPDVKAETGESAAVAKTRESIEDPALPPEALIAAALGELLPKPENPSPEAAAPAPQKQEAVPDFVELEEETLIPAHSPQQDTLEAAIEAVCLDAGFAGPERLSEALAILSEAEDVVLDFETTALTAYETPVAPSAAQRIGNATIKELRSQGCTLDPRPRARVLSLQIPRTRRGAPRVREDYRIAFDLDRLSEAELMTLARALHDKVWIGHNLGFDYTWMLTMDPEVRPRRIIDTMLLATTHRPQALYEMQAALVNSTIGNQHIRIALWNYVQDKMNRKKRDDDGDGALSLQSLALLYLRESLDKSYQKPHNWMVDRLTPQHWDYCMGDVDTPLRIACKLLDLPEHASVADILRAVDDGPGAVTYRIFESALHAIARMHHSGVSWSAERAAALDAELAREAEEAATKLLEIAPELGQPIRVPGKPTKKEPNPEPRELVVIDELLSPSKGLTAPVKAALARAIALETGRSVLTFDPPGSGEDEDSDGSAPEASIQLDAKRLAFDFPDSEVVKLLAAVQGAVKERSMLATFATHAEAAHDGRIHPLTGITTVTGRTSASSPSLQQVPRDKRFRAVFAARPGYRIVATDFSSIELRIAAALGVRAWRVLSMIEDLLRKGRDSPHRKEHPRIRKQIGWIFDKCPDLAEYLKSPDVSPPESLIETFTPRYGEASIEDYARFAACDLAKWVSRLRAATGGDPERLPFLSAYRQNLDPHLLTAIAMKAQAGEFDTGGKSPLDYLAGLSREETHALKEALKDARQAAKVVNFGSLYGQQSVGLHRYGVVAYGLFWSVEDAERAHTEWFRLYPEIGLWHWLLRRVFVLKKQPILNPYNPVEADLEGKIYRWATLSGRKVLSSKITSAANYEDQGTGAEIALLAINSLPEEIQAMLINFVHDELVLEVPDDRVTEVVPVVERTMTEAADRFLLPFGVPTTVETQVGDAWMH